MRLSCRGTQITMQSDSVAAYGGNVVQFIGHVKYRDSTLTMDADNGAYYKAGEKWEARGHVTTENLLTGSTLTGPSLDYYRVVKGVRDTLEMYATGRPKIHTTPRIRPDSPAEPYIIVGDRVRFKGSDRIYAGGKVTIDRSDFAARGDSLRLDTGAGSDGTLIGGPPILRGLGPDSFSVAGNRIDLKLERRELTYLLARGNGHAVSRDWDLVADTIGLDVNNRKLEQTLAWGKKSRPVGDLPGIRHEGRLARARHARASGSPRSAASARRGWAGRSTRPSRTGTGCGATPSSRTSPRWIRPARPAAALTRIDARHGAQSYHIDANAKLPTRPSINYARGDAITVTMRNGDSSRRRSGRRAGQGGRGAVGGQPRQHAPGRQHPSRHARPMSPAEWIRRPRRSRPLGAHRAGGDRARRRPVGPGGVQRPGDGVPRGPHRRVSRRCHGPGRPRSPATRCGAT